MRLAPGASLGAPPVVRVAADVAAIGSYALAPAAHGLHALAAWYGLADAVLTEVAARHKDIHPGPSAVRCWPHHFDIATYVALEEGDFEVARGVGIGLSALAGLLIAGGALSAIPFGTALLLMLLCVGVALVAALSSAWEASGELPMNVLRYE